MSKERIPPADRSGELAAVLEAKLAEFVIEDWDYGYDIGPAPVETPFGICGGYLVIISCRSPVLEPSRLSASHTIPHGWPSDDQIDGAVKSCVRQLLTARKQLLKTP